MTDFRSFIVRGLPEERELADAVEDLLRRRKSELTIYVRRSNDPSVNPDQTMELKIKNLRAIYTSPDSSRIYFMGITGDCEAARNGEVAEVTYNRERAAGEVNIFSFMPRHLQDKFA